MYCWPVVIIWHDSVHDVILFQQCENKQLRDTVLRLEEENGSLAQEVVETKQDLHSQMDKVRSALL